MIDDAVESHPTDLDLALMQQDIFHLQIGMDELATVQFAVPLNQLSEDYHLNIHCGYGLGFAEGTVLEGQVVLQAATVAVV